MNISQLLDLAVEHHRARRLREAEMLYRQVLVAQPNHAEALHLLGLLAFEGGQRPAAQGLIRRAIQIDPRVPSYHNNLGQILMAENNAAAAIEAFASALQLKPDYADALFNLGHALQTTGRLGESIEAYLKTLILRPDWAQVHINLGAALREKGDFEEALASYRQAVALRPDLLEAHNNLGELLQNDGQLEEAFDCYRRALQLRTHDILTQSNLGSLLIEMGKLDEANDLLTRALALAPDHPNINFNLGLIKLLRGDLPNGLRQAELYWRTIRAYPFNASCKPEWNGEDLQGKRILLFAEQGFGDAIHFIRYAPLVAQRDAQVIVAVYPELVRLFQSIGGGVKVVADDGPAPEYDLQCSLPRLALVMQTTFEAIPATVPYLHADPGLSSLWRDRLPKDQLNVGLAWAGRPTNRADRKRSIPPGALAGLMEVPNVNLVSLKKDKNGAGGIKRQNKFAIRSFQVENSLINWTDELHDFADTAALIDSLDLVITVDTAIAHLAGALGKATWVLLPFLPDWRWMLDRPVSPWYPTMQLFRQLKPGDWSSPIDAVTQALRSRTGP